MLAFALISTKRKIENIEKLIKSTLPPPSYSPRCAAFNPCSADNSLLTANAHGVAPEAALCRATMIPIEAGGGRAEGLESVPDQ